MVGACSLNLAVLERGLAVLRRGYSPAWRFFLFLYFICSSEDWFPLSKKNHEGSPPASGDSYFDQFRAKTETVLKILNFPQ